MKQKDDNKAQIYTTAGHQAEEFKIWDILSILLSKKNLIIIFTVVLTLIVFLVTYYNYITMPGTRVSVLNFSLMFEGINNGLYPNGSKFVETDIISTPVLQEVYDNNSDLKTYYGSFGNFKRTISIQRYNPGLEFLNYEFKAKLSDKKLSSAARYEVEQEFYRQTANIVAKPIFNLIATYSDVDKYKVPSEVTSKALNEILTTWLSMARTYQGITKYNVSLISNKVDNKFIKGIDYFKGADFLRLLLDDLNKDVTILEGLPNIKHLEIKYDNTTYTIKDINVRIKFMRNYMMSPLFEVIKASNAYKNKQNVRVYIKSQINILESNINVLKRENENYENMLLEHYISSPEPIMKLNAKIALLDREMSFYKEFSKTLDSYNDSKASPAAVKEIDDYLTRLSKAENLLITLINQFYQRTCKYNLDNKANFYKVNSFSSFVWNKYNTKYIVGMAMIVWGVLELIFLSILITMGLYHLQKKEQFLHYRDREDVQLRTLPERSESLERRKKIPK